MSEQEKIFSRRLLAAIRRYFVSGTLIVAPLIITYLALKFLFESIDDVLRPYLESILGYQLPGIGLVTTLLLILLVGIFARNYFGSRSIRLGERALTSFPVVRTIYLAAKQLVEGLAQPSKRAFKEVALVQTPRKGLYSLCFVISRPKLRTDAEERQKVCLFVPSTPTPVSGAVLIAEPDEVILLDMSVEDGIKFLVSGGIASPDTLSGRFLSSPQVDETPDKPGGASV